MSQPTVSPPLQRTSLHAVHVAFGARMVPFGGWEMPVQYSGILEEHQAVRQDVGLFDVSHMGEFHVTGPGALAFVDRVVANDVAGLAPDQALYTQFVRPDGGTVDDLLVYRRPDGYLLVVNASNIAKDWAWLQAHRPADVVLEDRSAETAMLALQGPRAEALLAPRVQGGTPLAALGSFRWTDTHFGALPVTVARTGYTGEDGFEIFCAAADAPALWEALAAAGVLSPNSIIAPAQRITHSETDYSRDDFPDQVDDLLIDTGMDTVAKSTQPMALEVSPLLAAPLQKLRACVTDILDSEQRSALIVDLSTFEGQPVGILLTPTSAPGWMQATVVDTDCHLAYRSVITVP